MRAATEQEFTEWLTHPTTQWVRGVFAARREARRQEWEGGAFSAMATSEYAILNAAAVGECRGLAFAQDMDYESFTQEIEDGNREQERAGPAGSRRLDQGVHAGEESQHD